MNIFRNVASLKGGLRLPTAAAITGSVLLVANAASAQFSPVRPPLVPLITRNPYVNTWVTTDAPGSGNWSSFWNGSTKAIDIMASVDGKVYLLMGRPISVEQPPYNAVQTNLEVTPTQSIYSMTCGDVKVRMDFLSPIEGSDLRRMSMPLGDVFITAISADGAPHAVKFYADISGEWANGNSASLINWNMETIKRNSDDSSTDGDLAAWEISNQNSSVLTESNEYPNWGTAVFATAASSHVTAQSGSDNVVRTAFIGQQALVNGSDPNQPRAISDHWPVFAYCFDAGNITSTPSDPFTLILGYVRNPAVSYLGQQVPPLWLSYWSTYEKMLAFAYNDSMEEQTRSNNFDRIVTAAATKAGGVHYAGIVDVSLRQAFAGTELVGTADKPWLYLKEISSDGNVSTIDVAYPAFSAYLYTDPNLVKLMLDPLVNYAESGKWPQKFAEHDLGSSYPNGSGHNDGGGENMPVEESANMLIMAAAYLKYNSDQTATAAYAQQHYAIYKQWADYLLTVPAGLTYCNALDPQFQNQTDDFTGPIAHSSNLALKAILAVGAMGQIAKQAGNSADADTYSKQAKTLIKQWVALSQNSKATHLLLQYQEAKNSASPDTTNESDDAWSLKYNAYPDKLLGLKLIPGNVLSEEANFYMSKKLPYGIQLDYRNNYTKIDWELFTAASTNSQALYQEIIDGVYNYVNTTPSAVPLSDWYKPQDGTANGFQARPVVGGLLAPLIVRTGIYAKPKH
jgi:hypothetical protein